MYNLKEESEEASQQHAAHHVTRRWSSTRCQQVKSKASSLDPDSLDFRINQSSSSEWRVSMFAFDLIS